MEAAVVAAVEQLLEAVVQLLWEERPHLPPPAAEHSEQKEILNLKTHYHKGSAVP